MSAVADESVPRWCKRRHAASGQWVYKNRYGLRADAVADNVDPSQQPYVCPDCGFWHLGHSALASAPSEVDR